MSNIPQSVYNLLPRKLLLQKDHPLKIIKQIICKTDSLKDFVVFDNLDPEVSVHDCFDSLLIPKDHPSRSKSDTFYTDYGTVLRSHTSAHQNQLLLQGHHQFICTGDVYRRDEIDKYHHHCFHQLDSAKVMPLGTTKEECMQDLKNTLVQIVTNLFGQCNYIWSDSYFPFVDPGIELEIEYFDRKIEVLGAGIVHNDIMKNCGLENRVAWAFGLGLERLAMILFDIPDIRLFWSTDSRFLSQFNENSTILNKFKPFSKYSSIMKDVSFWIPEGLHENDIYDTIRNNSTEDVESVEKITEYIKDDKISYTYRITYRNLYHNLTHTEVNDIQKSICESLKSQLKVILR